MIADKGEPFIERLAFSRFGVRMTEARYSILDRLAVALATGLGVGFIPWAPGTFGSLWGIALYWLIASWSLPIVIGVSLPFIVLGIPICSRAARLLGKHDPGSVVYDEIAAFWVVYLPTLAFSMEPPTWTVAIVGFVLFRFFDILKFWPCRRLEKLPDGLGIMSDDLAAGVYAGVILLAVVLAT